MAFDTLISVPDLAAHLNHPDWQVIDCRFNLQDTEEGRQHYQQQHIPGAVYAHLDEDLSAPVVTGVTGRHPLPDIDTCARTFSRLGISKGVQVVA
jgi:thiosulfate/3-mercaptopyruvate sulfurtransferase